ncbi:MAG TPA: ABC-2 family transporter protein [Chloroflexota bacterium]|jgi:ABC-2 type transport system permease protein
MRQLRGYWRTAAMAASAFVGDSRLFLFDYALRLLRVLLLLALWRQILGPDGKAASYTTATVLTYTLIAEVFADQLAARTELVQTFWEGTFVNRLLQPVGLVGLFVSEMVGRWLFNLAIFSLPLLLLSPLLGVDPRPASFGAAALFVASLVLAVSVGVALDFIFGGLTIALEAPVWLIEYVRGAIVAVLSGVLLPLDLLPWGLGAILDYLPFAATASTPLRIYVGTGAALPLMLVQLGWSVVLWPLALWIWAANRERVVGYGG